MHNPARTARFAGPLCALLWLAGALLARPFVETGFVDDFSYVQSAWVFARTHHLVYNGWATATIGWQIAWGGLFAQVFGNTFTAVRLSTFATAFLTVWLAQAIGVRCGLSLRNSVTAALALAFSPIFLPMSISFMTDVSGLFCILLCMYCGLRALSAGADRGTVLWLGAGFLAGTVGATARQIAWMAPLVLLPSAAWIVRRRRGVPVVALAGFLLTAASLFGSMRWFFRQPLSVPEGLIQGAIDARSLRELFGNMTAAVLCLLLLLLPVLAAWLVRGSGKRRLLWAALATLPLAFACRAITLHGMEKGWAPWTGDILDKIGMLDFRNAWLLGVGPGFPLPLRIALSAFTISAALQFVLTAFHERGTTAPPAGAYAPSWRDLLTICVPFLLAYFALLAPRAMWGIVIDRYLLPPLFFALIFLLRLYQERAAATLPLLSHALLAAYALFSVAGTHDWVAQHRARVAATARLQSMGVERRSIQAGYESDGLVQIQAAGTVIDPRIHYPAGFHPPAADTAGVPAGCREIFNPHTPAIHPVLFLSLSPAEGSQTAGDPPCLVSSTISAEVYRALLPPFHRRIYVLQRPR